MNNKRICITGGCQGAGATFFATTLAFVLAEKVDGVTFVESPKANRYKEETDLVSQLSMENIVSNRGLRLFHNINWIIRDDYKMNSDGINFIERIPGKYILCDCPIEYRKYDLIICVVDALPSRVVASKKTVNHFKNYFSNRILWVLNRDFNGDCKKIEKYLGVKFDYIIPAESQELFYKAERFGRPLAKSQYMQKETKEKFQEIASYILSLY